MKIKPRYLIGIDPGVKTGLAVWDRQKKSFHAIETTNIVSAMVCVDGFPRNDIEVWFEDARLRKWFGNSGREKLQGAGSIKRDCSIWEEFVKLLDIPYKAIPPKNNTTKTKAEYFYKITGWSGRTSEHARDAAMLVFGG